MSTTTGISAPLVSVTMPTYNNAPYLGEAIDSIVNQSFDDWELIIVDDGSTDGSSHILAEYETRDRRIRVFRIPHAGRGKARNKCIEEARGKYIAVCDSDDVSLPQRFAKQVSFLATNPGVGVVSADVAHYNGKVLPIPAFQYPYDPDEIKRWFDRGKMGVSHSASMFRHSLLEVVGLYSEECLRAQDLEFFLRVNEVSRFAVLPEVLLYYRNDPRHMTYQFWLLLCKYGRYAVYRRNQFRRHAAPISFCQWQATYACRWRVYVLDNLRFIKYFLKYKF